MDDKGEDEAKRGSDSFLYGFFAPSASAFYPLSNQSHLVMVCSVPGEKSTEKLLQELMAKLKWSHAAHLAASALGSDNH